MKINEAIEIIRFNTGTLNDLSNKSLNNLFTDRNITRQLKYALDKYANYTKAIEDIYSVPLEQETEFIDAPPLSLRGESYHLVLIWLEQRRYMMSDPGLATQNTDWSYQNIKGIPRWFVPWSDKVYVSPNASILYNSTTLNGNITATDTTITLTDSTNFLLYQGRITIGNEKILYKYKTGNVLYECQRGIEQTVAAVHSDLDAVKENNMWSFYRRLHIDITENQSNWDNELEVPAEHVEVITDYTSYKLLSKIDPARAAFYKVNFDQWLKDAKYSIKKGRSDIPNTGFIRQPYYWETNYASHIY